MVKRALTNENSMHDLAILDGHGFDLKISNIILKIQFQKYFIYVLFNTYTIFPFLSDCELSRRRLQFTMQKGTPLLLDR